MKKFIQIFLIIISVLLLLLILTNPSLKSFKDYRCGGRECFANKTNDFFIYSKFELSYDNVNEKYIGIGNNFFKLKQP